MQSQHFFLKSSYLNAYTNVPNTITYLTFKLCVGLLWDIMKLIVHFYSVAMIFSGGGGGSFSAKSGNLSTFFAANKGVQGHAPPDF